MSGRKHNPPKRADIELTASIRADELRFKEVPETDVSFTGDPGHRSTSGAERENLPEKVDPGVTYRDVRVDYRLATRLARRRGRGEPPARP